MGDNGAENIRRLLTSHYGTQVHTHAISGAVLLSLTDEESPATDCVDALEYPNMIVLL